MSGEKKYEDIKTLKPGKYVLIDDVPCRVQKISSSAPGKHGHAKFRVEAVGVFDNQKRSIMAPSGHEVPIPIIEKKQAQILAIMGDNIQVMDHTSYEVFELPIPEDLKSKVEAGKDIEYLEWGNLRKVERVRGGS